MWQANRLPLEAHVGCVEQCLLRLQTAVAEDVVSLLLPGFSFASGCVEDLFWDAVGSVA